MSGRVSSSTSAHTRQIVHHSGTEKTNEKTNKHQPSRTNLAQGRHVQQAARFAQRSAVVNVPVRQQKTAAQRRSEALASNEKALRETRARVDEALGHASNVKDLNRYQEGIVGAGAAMSGLTDTIVSGGHALVTWDSSKFKNGLNRLGDEGGHMFGELHSQIESLRKDEKTLKKQQAKYEKLSKEYADKLHNGASPDSKEMKTLAARRDHARAVVVATSKMVEQKAAVLMRKSKEFKQSEFKAGANVAGAAAGVLGGGSVVGKQALKEAFKHYAAEELIKHAVIHSDQ